MLYYTSKYFKVLVINRRLSYIPCMENKLNPDLELFTSSEVAAILKMNVQVVARKLQCGEMEGYKIGKDWRVSQKHLLKFLEKHTNQKSTLSPREHVLNSFFENGKLK